jgi:hypothetical protein
MKKLLSITFLLSILVSSCFAQAGKNIELKTNAYIGHKGVGEFTLEDFKKEKTIKLTNDSLTLYSYVAFFSYNPDKKMDGLFQGGNVINSLPFLDKLKKYKPPFYIIFDYLVAYDGVGNKCFAPEFSIWIASKK